MPLATKDICSLLFAKKDDGRYQCTTCTKLYSSTHGYTNLPNHLKRHHPTFEADAQEATKRHNALQLRVVDPQTRDGFRWIEWVAMERLPFSFVERSFV
ncbi:hypothetical protein PI125_g19202 [Phytophthora idaei]|nr:hypothetical protein PI125_g19202 [Phytophthora idaei]